MFLWSAHDVEVHCSIVHNTCSNDNTRKESKPTTVRKGPIYRKRANLNTRGEVCGSPSKFILVALQLILFVIL